MPVMRYSEWISRTKVFGHRRSPQLKLLDAAIREYELHPNSPPYFETLQAAFLGWADSKASAEGSIRNGKHAISDLIQQISEIVQAKLASPAFRAVHAPAAHLRAGGLLAEIEAGAKLMKQGNLRPQIRVTLDVGVTDRSLGYVVYENFEDDELIRAKAAWAHIFEAAKLAAYFANDAKTNRYATRFRNADGLWFNAASGPNVKQQVDTLMTGVQAMWVAFQQKKITLRYSPDQPDIRVDKQKPFGDMIVNSPGQGYGSVWNQHEGGGESGYRIGLHNLFFEDPSQTIYHEMSHKVLKTEDHKYGVEKCKALAQKDPGLALQNADSWGYFAMEFNK